MPDVGHQSEPVCYLVEYRLYYLFSIISYILGEMTYQSSTIDSKKVCPGAAVYFIYICTLSFKVKRSVKNDVHKIYLYCSVPINNMHA